MNVIEIGFSFIEHFQLFAIYRYTLSNTLRYMCSYTVVLYIPTTHSHTPNQFRMNIYEIFWGHIVLSCMLPAWTNINYELCIINGRQKWSDVIAHTCFMKSRARKPIFGRNSYRKSGNTVHRMYKMRYGETITGHLNLHLGYFALIQ